MFARSRQQGFSLIELLIVVGIIGIIAAIAVPNLLNALQDGRRAALAADGRTLLAAFQGYHVTYNEYPPCCSPPALALNVSTLFPLTEGPYLSNGTAITGKLAGGQLTSYDSPDNPSSNHDFYAVMTLSGSNAVAVLVADTDEYPGHEGTALHGVYFIEGSTLTRAE